MNLFVFNATITKDIELKMSQNGNMPIIQNSLAFNKKDTQGNQQTMFMDFVAFGKSAELIAQYYQKGDSLCGVGEISMDMWQDQQTGQNRIKHKIIVQRLEFTRSPKAWQHSQNGANAQNGANIQNGANGYLNQNIANHNVRDDANNAGNTDNLGYPTQSHLMAPDEIPF